MAKQDVPYHPILMFLEALREGSERTWELYQNPVEKTSSRSSMIWNPGPEDLRRVYDTKVAHQVSPILEYIPDLPEGNPLRDFTVKKIRKPFEFLESMFARYEEDNDRVITPHDWRIFGKTLQQVAKASRALESYVHQELARQAVSQA